MIPCTARNLHHIIVSQLHVQTVSCVAESKSRQVMFLEEFQKNVWKWFDIIIIGGLQKSLQIFQELINWGLE